MVTSCWYERSCLLAWLSLISMVMPPSSARPGPVLPDWPAAMPASATLKNWPSERS
jgi:hypothetical protein